MTTRTCGACTHGLFTRTPTGRMKAGISGQCADVVGLFKLFKGPDFYPPTLQGPSTPVTIIKIWPDSDATRCPSFEQK